MRCLLAASERLPINLFTPQVERRTLSFWKADVSQDPWPLSDIKRTFVRIYPLRNLYRFSNNIICQNSNRPRMDPCGTSLIIFW